MANLHSDYFSIGYGNSTCVINDSDTSSVELYYGDFNIKNNDINNVINNWGDNKALKYINTSGVYIGFDNDKLWAEDDDGCGIYWDLDTFKKYFCN